MRQANFEIVEQESHKAVLVIRDVGPHSQHPTITNDAEGVVERLVREGHLNGRRLFYYDSQGGFDELVVTDGKFSGFKSGKAKLLDVEIEEKPDLDEPTRKTITCWPIWSNVDRPKSSGISCGWAGPKAQALAQRVKRACMAGKAIVKECNVGCDTGGQTYAKAHLQLRGRALNADLRSLGF